MTNLVTKNWIGVLAVILCGVLGACKPRAETPKQAQPPAPDQPRPAAFVLTDELNAILVTADAADGKEDHVVSKCITCKLGMNGNAAHAAKAGDYTAHLCSDGCKAAFERDPAKAILAVKPK